MTDDYREKFKLIQEFRTSSEETIKAVESRLNWYKGVMDVDGDLIEEKKRLRHMLQYNQNLLVILDLAQKRLKMEVES